MLACLYSYEGDLALLIELFLPLNGRPWLGRYAAFVLDFFTSGRAWPEIL
jgi:hypothetical protein